MQIQSTNNNPNFGNLKGIKYTKGFNNKDAKCAQILKEFTNSEAIKKFGEKYNFIAELEYNQLLPEKLLYSTYNIYLKPVDKRTTFIEKIKNLFRRIKNGHKIVNLPAEFRVWNSSNTFFNYNLEKLQNLKLTDIENSMKNKIEKQPEEKIINEQEEQLKKKIRHKLKHEVIKILLS